MKNKFDNMTFEHGGLLKEHTAEKNIWERCQRHQELFSWFFKPNVYAKDSDFVINNLYIDYIDNKSINAIAIVSDEREFVGIYYGVIINLQKAFDFYLSSHDTFLNLGSNDKEAHNKKDFINTIKTLDFDKIKQTVPTCSIRKNVSDWLSFISMTFLLGHEIGHIIKGHFIILSEKHDSQYSFFEINGDDNSKIDQKIIEVSADENGVKSSINTWLSIFPANQDILEKNPYYIWAFSIGILFLIFELNHYNNNKTHPSQYPPARVRFRISLIYALAYIRERKNEEESIFLQGCGLAFKELIPIWVGLEESQDYKDFLNLSEQDIGEQAIRLVNQSSRFDHHEVQSAVTTRKNSIKI